MRRAVWGLAAAVVLSGCAGKMIEDGTQKMVGQPVSVAIAKLGMPTGEQMIAGQKVYTWYTGRMVEGSTQQCRIRAIMQGDRIGSFDYEGNNGACMRYAMSLSD